MVPTDDGSATAAADDLVDALVRTLERRDSIAPREVAALIAASGAVRTFSAGDMLVRAHAGVQASTLLLDGMISREFSLPSGKQQIVALHVPGDFLDLHGFILKSLDHDVVALTDVRVAQFPHVAIREITRTEPHLTRMLWLLTTIDAAVHREWIGRLGHSAGVRVAHLLCEIQARLAIVGCASDEGFALKLTQTHLGDMAGLTAVHVNRTLRRLRETNLVAIRDGHVVIPDLERLRTFAGFDDRYLYLEPSPR